ncbi:MAG: Gfo/Idh/MocA family oxidoreductase [Thermaceae bacterium]|nr:Gfo/Idh/MocA family oxidoreductase [Thermaceae bacterium]
MIKFALFGAGFIGNVHGRNIAAHPKAQLSYVFDVNQHSAQALASSLGAAVAHSPEEIWNSNVDAVLIASSTNTHADLLEAAIRAGKPVFCEKPIDLNIERVKGVVQLAQDHPVPILVGFSRRFDANHLGVLEAVRSETIGKLEILHLTSRGPTPPPISYVKVSGGQLRDQTIHFFDLACWIAGEAPLEVYASGAALVDPAIGEAGDVDTSLVILKMPSGAFVHIDSSRRTGYGYDERIEAFGSQGLVESQRKPTGEVVLYKGQQKTSNGLHAGWFERMEPTFMLALDAFVCSLEGQTSPYPNLLDGLQAQLIAEAAAQSLQTNRPVKVEYWLPSTPALS